MNSILVLSLLLVSVAEMAFAQSHATGSRAKFKELVAQLQGNPENQELREKVISFALKMKPKPAISEEANRHFIRGTVAMKDAVNERDFKDAADEFAKAALISPWFADAYYNGGMALSRANDYEGATRALNLYLLTAPNPADAKQAKDLLYQIEYKQEKAGKDRAERDAAKAGVDGLNGHWICSDSSDCNWADVSLANQSFHAMVDIPPVKGGGGRWKSYDDDGRLVKENGVVFDGILEGLSLSGTARIRRQYNPYTHCEVPSDTNQFTGTISEDWKQITLQTQMATFATCGQGDQCCGVKLDHREPWNVVLDSR